MPPREHKRVEFILPKENRGNTVPHIDTIKYKNLKKASRNIRFDNGFAITRFVYEDWLIDDYMPINLSSQDIVIGKFTIIYGHGKTLILSLQEI